MKVVPSCKNQIATFVFLRLPDENIFRSKVAGSWVGGVSRYGCINIIVIFSLLRTRSGYKTKLGRLSVPLLRPETFFAKKRKLQKNESSNQALRPVRDLVLDVG